MGIELARAYVTVRGDTTQLPGDFADVRGMLDDLLADARTYAAGFLYSVSGMFQGLLAAGAATVARNEQTFVAFETLIGSAEETKKLLADITNFAAKTPFEMPQLLGVTRELLTFGERGKQLMDTLKLLGDASGGTAEKFSILGTVFNQIRAEQRLLMQDFRQLSSRGILSFKDIKEYYNLGSEKAAVAKLSSGSVRFEDVRNILKMLTSEGGRFFNSMERQSTTLIGLQSTYNDAIAILGSRFAEVMAPLDKLILKLKIGLVGAIDSVTVASKGMVAGMVQGSVAAAKLGAVLLAGQLAMRLFGAQIKTAIIGTGIGAVILAIGAAIGGLIGYFAKSEEGLRAWTAVSKDFKIVWRNIKDAFVEFQKSASEAFENVFGMTFSQALQKGSKSLADWIISASKWIVQLSYSFEVMMATVSFILRNGWDLLSIASIDFTVGLIDSIQQLQIAFRTFASWVGQVFVGLEYMFSAIGNNIYVKITTIKERVIAELAAAWAGMEALWAGENPLTAMEAEYAAVYEELTKGKDTKQKDVVEEFKKGFKAGAVPVDEEGLVLQETELGLLEQKKLLQDQIDRREEERLRRRGPGGEKPDETKEKAEEKKPMPLIKTGKYGFEQFGSALQDAILKGAGADKQQQMVDLLGNGNVIQEKQLQVMQQGALGGGLAP